VRNVALQFVLMRSVTVAVPFLGSFLLVILATPELHAQSVRVDGIVRDPSGASIPGIEVKLRCRTYNSSRVTDSAGVFVFEELPATEGTIEVQARGFAPVSLNWSVPPGGSIHLEVSLSPAPVTERVTVTATRTQMRLSDTPGSARLLSADDLGTTAALTIDDTLRQVPGFTLFRRSGSRTANPTSQGVSLRGLAASGASRALVLEEGIPLNDPFGGWVYWGRIPRESVESIEVFRGAASNLYGSDALGGVVQVLTRDAKQSGLLLESSYGNERTPDLSLWAGGGAGRWAARVAVEAFHTDGYILLPSPQRGRIDTPAGSEHATTDLTVERRVRENGRLFARGSFFDESRNNGTPLQINNTGIGQIVFGGDGQLGALGSLSGRLYGSAQAFDQNFSAVAADRMTETLTDIQHVPAQQVGGTAQWSRPAGKHQTLVAGVDAQEVRGVSKERVLTAGNVSATITAGGRQRRVGTFVEDIFRVRSHWTVMAGARFDHWRNFDAQSMRVALAPPGPTVVTPFADRTESAFSPRISVLHQLSEKVSLTASAYRAFRAPTLNELYRPFRVGNVVTLSNDALRAERLTGGEAGAGVTSFRKRLGVRGILFWGEIVNPIANVTLKVQPSLITRQRQNLGRTRSAGIELDAVARLGATVEISCGYEYVAATVLRFPANKALEGLWIPQVPRHDLTFQVRYSNPSRLTFGIQGRFVGAQFDDDLNQFRLGHYYSMDAIASHSMAHGVDIFVALENLLNQRYTVGLTPVATLGPPLLARFGVRLQVPAH
jgi:outer membrane receptor protein involved in Fe transport